jgi:hypothetical protein
MRCFWIGFFIGWIGVPAVRMIRASYRKRQVV